MTYSQQSFTSNQLLTSSEMNVMEKNVISTREIAGEARKLGTPFWLSVSNTNKLNFTTQTYIDTFGNTYWEALGGGDYGWRVTESLSHDIISFSSHVVFETALVSSAYVALELVDTINFRSLRTPLTFVSSVSGTGINPSLSISGSLITTRIISAATSIEHMRLNVISNTSSVRAIDNSGNSWASIRYLTRNY